MADQLIVKLGADTSEFRGEIAKAGAEVGKTLGDEGGSNAGERFGKAFMKKINLDKAFKSLVGAVGIDVSNIAESIARLWTGVSKEEEANWKKLEELSDRVADANIKALQASLTEEKKYQLALRERAGALARIADIDKSTAKGQVETKEQELRLAQALETISAHRLLIEKQTTDELKDRIDVNEAGRKASRENVTLLARRIELVREDVVLAKVGVDLANTIAEREAWTNVLKGRQVQYEQLQAQFKKEHALSEKEVVEYTRLEAEAQIGKLLPAGRARLDQIKLIVKEKENEAKIDTILGVPAAKRTFEEKQTLGILGDQNKSLDKQIAQKQAIIDKIVTQQVEEKKVRDDSMDMHILDGDLGVAKVLGGIRVSSDPGRQYDYDQSLLAAATRDNQREIETLQRTIDRYQQGGAGIGKFELPALLARLKALQSRRDNISSYVFNPNYQDAAGQGIFASQVSTIGDPLGLQKKQTDTLQQVSGGITELNTRLRMAGFGTGG